MTTPWPDEADLPPDRPVVTVHLPEETEMDASTPATPPEIPAAAPTPPGGDTTLDEAREAPYDYDFVPSEGLEVVEVLGGHEACRAEVAALTARHAADAEAARLRIAELERERDSGAWRGYCVAEASVDRLKGELATAVQRGREQAAQAIEAKAAIYAQSAEQYPPESGGAKWSNRNVLGAYRHAAQLARGATPTPAGGEAESEPATDPAPAWRVSDQGAHVVDEFGRHVASTRNRREAARVVAEVERLRVEAGRFRREAESLGRRLALDFDQRYPAASTPPAEGSGASEITPEEFVQFDADVASCRTREPDTAMDGAAHSVWLHGKWRWLTQQMTTSEREAFAAAVVRHSAALDPDEPVALDDLRWWRNAAGRLRAPHPSGPIEMHDADCPESSPCKNRECECWCHVEPAPAPPAEEPEPAEGEEELRLDVGVLSDRDRELIEKITHLRPGPELHVKFEDDEPPAPTSRKGESRG